MTKPLHRNKRTDTSEKKTIAPSVKRKTVKNQRVQKEISGK
jgi:hypothetical protein